MSERNPEGTWERYLALIDECARLQECQRQASRYVEAALQGYPNDGDILAARDWLMGSPPGSETPTAPSVKTVTETDTGAAGYCGRHGLFTGRMCPRCADAAAAPPEGATAP